MHNKGIEYKFSAKVCHYSSNDMSGWHLVFLPKEISKEIRGNLKFLEEGWGRLKIIAKNGNCEWQTAIWFDTKHETYLLPIKAEIRKKENIIIGDDVEITIWI